MPSKMSILCVKLRILKRGVVSDAAADTSLRDSLEPATLGAAVEPINNGQDIGAGRGKAKSHINAKWCLCTKVQYKLFRGVGRVNNYSHCPWCGTKQTPVSP